MKDYNCEILYHHGKANVVVDALSRKSFGSLSVLRKISKPLQEEICREKIEIVVGKLGTMTLQSTLLEKIKQVQLTDPYLIKKRLN